MIMSFYKFCLPETISYWGFLVYDLFDWLYQEVSDYEAKSVTERARSATCDRIYIIVMCGTYINLMLVRRDRILWNARKPWLQRLATKLYYCLPFWLSYVFVRSSDTSTRRELRERRAETKETEKLKRHIRHHVRDWQDWWTTRSGCNKHLSE